MAAASASRVGAPATEYHSTATIAQEGESASAMRARARRPQEGLKAGRQENGQYNHGAGFTVWMHPDHVVGAGSAEAPGRAHGLGS